MYSSVTDVGVIGATTVLVVFSSAVKGVDGSDVTSSELTGNSATPSSVSLNFATAVSFSSLINLLNMIALKKLIDSKNIKYIKVIDIK